MKGKLKSKNMFSILVQALIGVRILTLPGDVIRYAKSDSWLSMIIVYITTLATAYSFYWISTKYRGLDLAQIHTRVFGKFFGRILLIPTVIYTTLMVGLSVRLFSYSIKTFLLDKTPVVVIIGLMLISCLYCLGKDIRTISIVMDVLLPFILASCLLLVILPVGSAEPGNILPVLHRGIKPVIRGAIQIIDPVMPTALVSFIMPYLEETKSVKKYIFWAVSVAAIIYLAIILICLMVFGSEEINYILFPTLIITKTIEAKSIVFERAESLFMITWIPITFSSVLLNYFASTLIIKTFLNAKRDKLIMYGQLPVLIAVALFPKNIVELLKYLSYSGVLARILNFIYHPIFTLIVYLKNRRKNKNES